MIRGVESCIHLNQDRTREVQELFRAKSVVRELIFQAVHILKTQDRRVYQGKSKTLFPAEFGYQHQIHPEQINLSLLAKRSELIITCKDYPESKLKAYFVLHEGLLALKFALNTRQAGQPTPFMFGADFVAQALWYFESLNGPINHVLTHWQESDGTGVGCYGESINYDQYHRALPTLVDSRAKNQAAQATWTGKVLAGLGFSEISKVEHIRVPSYQGSASAVIAVFSKKSFPSSVSLN